MTDQLPIGIHFGVPEDVYFAQDALGSSDIKQLAIDPVEWQFERLHGEDKTTTSRLWGHALHCRVLEGRKAFENRFRIEPVKTQIAGILDTVEDMQKWLTERGITFKKTLKKDGLVSLIKLNDENAVFWHEIKAEFDEACPPERRITPKIQTEINLAAAWMQEDPMLSPVMEDGAFVMGAPEVTIIYDQGGVRRRARMDFLLPRRVIDLKSYAPWKNGNHLAGITQAIGNWRHDIQAADYLNAHRYARDLFARGKVYGKEPFEGYAAQCFDVDDDPKWIWVMVKSTGAPQSRPVELPANTLMFQTAQMLVEDALSTYRKYRDQYGADNDWKPEPGSFVLSDTDMPAWFGHY